MSNRSCIAACAVAVLAIAAPPASAQTGGAVAPEPPEVSAVTCLASSACAKRSTVIRGVELVLRGRRLEPVEQLVFGGRRGSRDDVRTSVTRGGERSAVAVVPAAARTGPLLLLGRGGSRLARVRRVAVRRAPKAARQDIGPGSSFFFAGRRKATFAFDVEQPTQAQVELVNEESQAVVRTWSVAAEPGRTATVRWDGRGSSGVEPPGRYRFRLVGAAEGSAVPAQEATTGFFFADHLFPIRGRHDLGQTPANDFGGARDHKGQDMFADCGTKLAAARGGRVQFAGYHSAAGNYLVIDGAGTGIDYVYMHMRAPATVKTGDRVFTGQKVGEVGETGRASGCHLHFELWSVPGWYEGGEAFDPLPSLKRWDGYS